MRSKQTRKGGRSTTKGGRPKLADRERRTHRVTLSLSTAEYQLLERAAKRDDRELAVFARRTLIEALKRRA